MAKKGANDFLTLGLVPLTGTAIGFLVAAVLGVVMVQSSANSSHREALMAREAAAIASVIDARQAAIVGQLSSIASSLRLSQIAETGDDTVFALEETNLTEQIPHAIRVRLFKRGAARIDRDTVPAFSFPSLDLVNRAEAGETIYPEAMSSNDRWLLSVAAPIALPDSASIKGTLFVYLDMQALQSALPDDLAGEVQILQTFGNNPPSAVLTVGASADAGSPAVTHGLKSPNWSLEFRPDDSLQGAGVIGVLVVLAGPLVFLLIALGGVLAGVVRTRSTLGDDATLLSMQMSGVLENTYSPTTAYRFAPFAELDANLGKFGIKPRKAKAPVTPLDLEARVGPTPPRKEEMVDIEMIDEETYARETGSFEPVEEIDEIDEIEEELLNPSDMQDDVALANIFRAYDIRGVVNDTLTENVIYKIGLAIGSAAEEIGEQTILVGADGRVSSPDVMDTLIRGLLASGRDVVSIGMVPTPILYFALHNSDATSGVMVTGSHNPPDENGFKIVLGGDTLVDEDIQSLYQRVISDDFSDGNGELTEAEIIDDYMDAIADDIVVAQPLKIVVDCGNGVAGAVAPELYSMLGCDVVPLYCDVDGEFPNHHPDPTVAANLDDLRTVVKSEGADLGLAFDGDGDRLVAVDEDGEIIWPDRLLMLFAKDVVSRNPGSDVVYDLKCTRHLNTVISSFGGRPIMCRSGHSYLKAKVKETDAALGGELSGHICFGERWFGFDDGLYSGARLLEVVGATSDGLKELMTEFPTSINTPEIRIDTDDVRKFEIVKAMASGDEFDGGTPTTIDGLRIDFADGWGLVRASNTEPCLTLRFEADSTDALARISAEFKSRLAAIDAGLDLDF